MNKENFIKEHSTESLKDSGSSISKALRVAFTVGTSLFTVFSLVYFYYIPRMRSDFYAVKGKDLFLATIPVAIFVSVSVFFFVRMPLGNRKLKLLFFIPALMWLSILIISRAAIGLMDVGFVFFLGVIIFISLPFYFFYFSNWIKIKNRNNLDSIDKISFQIMLALSIPVILSLPLSIPFIFIVARGFFESLWF